jgi:hypothetical protein
VNAARYGGLLCGLLLVLVGAAAEEPAARLELGLEPGKVLTYHWEINTQWMLQEKESQTSGEVKRNTRLSVSLIGQEASKDAPGVALVKFAEPHLHEIEKIHTDVYDLKITPSRTLRTHNGEVVIDSENSVGIELLGETQQELRAFEQSVLRVHFDATGRHKRVDGNQALIERLQGGHAQQVFPILKGQPAQPGETWEETSQLYILGTHRLAEPVQVKSRMRFAKWVTDQQGRKLAFIEIVSSWASRQAMGQMEGGQMQMSQIEGVGIGEAYFDPAKKCWIKGELSYRLKYDVASTRLEPGQPPDTANAHVSGNARFSFTLVKETELSGPVKLHQE